MGYQDESVECGLSPQGTKDEPNKDRGFKAPEGGDKLVWKATEDFGVHRVRGQLTPGWRA